MKTLRLAFLLPALVAAAPAAASPHVRVVRPALVPRAATMPVARPEAPIRYVRLDQMIRAFAEQARADRALTQRGAILALR